LLRWIAAAALTTGSVTRAAAQETEPATREAAIEAAQAGKAGDLHPYAPGKAEAAMDRVEQTLEKGLSLHPFFDSAYSGGGFTLGAGYARYVSPYNILDVRGSITFTGYKRLESELIVPRLFRRRGSLSLLGGWREATQVGFYGIGPDTPQSARANYSFQQPYGSALLTFWPTRRFWMLRGGEELSRWSQNPGEGDEPSVETIYTPDTLAGLGARATYAHTLATAGADWRTSPGYSRRGGLYAATFHDYTDLDHEFGFNQVDYEVIQHFPILREAWVISLHGLAETAFAKNGQEIPFFMLPSLGGGSNLRGFSSWRFRDKNSLLLQAEWRIMVNRYFDTAFFCDAGKVAPRPADLSLNRLKDDFGFGIRFHGPIATPLRIELAKSNEGLSLVFAASAVF
jgi:hypothetical protein